MDFVNGAFFLYLFSYMQTCSLENDFHYQQKNLKFSKYLNYTGVQRMRSLNLYESSVKTGPVLQRYSSLKDRTWHKGKMSWYLPHQSLF